ARWRQGARVEGQMRRHHRWWMPAHATGFATVRAPERGVKEAARRCEGRASGRHGPSMGARASLAGRERPEHRVHRYELLARPTLRLASLDLDRVQSLPV